MKKRRSALELWKSIRRPPVRPAQSIETKKRKLASRRRPTKEDDE